MAPCPGADYSVETPPETTGSKWDTEHEQQGGMVGLSRLESPRGRGLEQKGWTCAGANWLSHIVTASGPAGGHRDAMTDASHGTVH